MQSWMSQTLISKLTAFTSLVSHSLKATLLFWFLTLSIIPFVAVAWYGYAHTVSSIDEMQRNKLSDTAGMNIEALNAHFDEAVRNLDSWAQLRSPAEILSALEQKFTQSGQSIGDFVDSQEYAKLLEAQPKTIEKIAKQYDYVYDIFLIDMRGNILYSVVHELDLGTNLHKGPYSQTKFAQSFRKTLKDRKAHFSDMERYGPSRNILAGFITSPIKDASGNMIGVMGLQLNMDVLFSSMKRKHEGLHQYLVGADGLLRTPIDDNSEILKRRIDTECFWNWNKEHGAHGTSPDTMDEEATLYTGPNKNKVLGKHHSVRLLDVRWAHISEMDYSKAMAVPDEIFKTLLIFTLSILCGVILIAILIARQIVKPIMLLSEVSKQYMNGAKEIQIELHSENEIGVFGKLFGSLIQKQRDDEEQLTYLSEKAKKALEELKEQKYALDAHSIVAITDVKGTITFVNKKFEEITGYTSEELLGQNHRILNSGLHSTEFWKEMYHTVSHGEIWHGEVYNVAKTGRHYWVDTTIVPFMDENGKPVSYIAIRTDITQRKATQDALNEALLLQKAVFEHAGVSIITTDKDGLVNGFNAAAETMTGYRSDEIVGKHTPAILHKIDEVVARAQEFSKELGKTVEPGFNVFVIKSQYNLPNSHEWTYIRKDGSELPVYLNVTALHETDGTISGYMGIASDVSLFKEAENQMLVAKEAAESSARVKSEFLATMSHEIRTPMNGVLGMLGLLEHTQLDETQRHQVRVAANSANSLLGLINDILDFSKVEAGKMDLELIEFNIGDELGEFVEAISFRAQEKGLELILDTTQLARTSVITDPGRLRQILTNLVGNAVKFTNRGDILIKVMLDEVDAKNARLRIDVRDSGIGIAADKIDKLFMTFAQADNSTTRKYGGTGLGLAIVKKLCELMDGSIWITSVEHEGSTFHVDIGVGLGEVSELSVPSVSLEGKSVFVVDDNETNRMVIRAQLEQWGMKVYEAEDPVIAFDYCQTRIAQGHIPPYDMAILDMQMPNMDGADLGAEIRNIKECDDMKLVMMTSLGSRNDAKRFAALGFDAFFAKPTTTKDLLNAFKVLFDEGENPLATKDYLGTLQDEMAQIQWPAHTRILLVDDNPTNQIVAQGMLEMIGLSADIANNGLEALESVQVALEIAPYTLVLMDCQMPEMDGYAASAAIREGKAGEENKGIPIVAMTANAMAGDREKCLISGMNDYVSKPINLVALKSVLIKWLDGTLVENDLHKNSRRLQIKQQDEGTKKPKTWDKADAIKRLGGRKELLLKVIKSFDDESRKIMRELNAAVIQENLPTIQLHAHSIKGSAGNVSAQQVQALAKTMELAAKNGDKSIVKETFANLEKEIQKVYKVFEKELEKEFKPDKGKKRIDAIAMAIKLQNLKKQLETGEFIDTQSLDVFGDYTDVEFTTQMSMLKGHIDRFDTSEAVALLETIMAGLE